jgi:hypothetical protein
MVSFGRNCPFLSLLPQKTSGGHADPIDRNMSLLARWMSAFLSCRHTARQTEIDHWWLSRREKDQTFVRWLQFFTLILKKSEDAKKRIDAKNWTRASQTNCFSSVIFLNFPFLLHFP